MGRVFRALCVAVVAFAGVISVAWTTTLTAMVQLLATTVLVMGGTQHPLIDPMGNVDSREAAGFVDSYVQAAATKYVGATNADPLYAIHTPEEFMPVFGSKTFDDSVQAGRTNLNNCVRGSVGCIEKNYNDPAGADPASFTVFGYSQSARVATLVKRDLLGNPGPNPVSFVLIGNPNRPNGGILERFTGLYIPILGVTFDGATPTNSCDASTCDLPTADITRQYDGWSDFPTYPMNLLAVANAIAGIQYLHPDYFVGTPENPVNSYLYQGQYGDTNYYMIPTERLPILLPLAQMGIPDPILAAMDAPLRVMIEWGYDRDVSPGEPTPAKWIRLKNPITDLVNLARAIPTGWDDGISAAAGDPNLRPFGTTPTTSTFGVGGNNLPTKANPELPTGPAPATLQANRQSVAPDTTGTPAPADEPPNGSVPDQVQLKLADGVHKPAKSDRPKGLLNRILRGQQSDVEAPAADGPKNPQPGGDRPFKRVLDALKPSKPAAAVPEKRVAKVQDDAA